MVTMGATTGMIAIIEIGIIATEIIGIGIAITTGIAIVAITATTGAIVSSKTVSRWPEWRATAELWVSPAFP